jgi:hypothetical protein
LSKKYYRGVRTDEKIRMTGFQDHNVYIFMPARTISKCSSMVFLVNGLVGFVELGKTFDSLTIFIMSGACPPPAPSV